MQDLLHQLISDTLLYLKDPLYLKDSILATQEECALFKLEPIVQPKTAPVFIPSSFFLPEKKETVFPSKQERQKPSPTSLPAQAPEETTPIKAMLSKIAPGMRLIDSVPDDTEGKKIGNTWREKILDAEVILLACKQDSDTLEFLKTLAKAINTHLTKCKILPAERLEKEKCWDLFLQKNSFRLIVASEGLEQLKELMRFYRGSPAQNTCFLDQIPLFPLLPASAYKQLDKKAEAWKRLCQILKK